MNAIQIIESAKEKAAEWIEIAEDPNEFLVWVLANKIEQQQKHIDFLERIRHEFVNRT